MTRDQLGTIRRSQVITTFGPGAVVDFRTGGRNGAPVSAVVCGLENWDALTDRPGLNHPQTIHEPRLQAVLGVGGFRMPPVTADDYWGSSGDGEALEANRFPRWLQCPRCSRLGKPREWGRKPGDVGLTCSACSRKSGAYPVRVVPVRLVTACPAGHLDEFPWHDWVGHKEGCSEPRLKLENWGGAGLTDLVLECLDCGAKNNMGGCFGDDALDQRCTGSRPWLQSDAESCGQPLRTMQRGASNLYFPALVSALAIPPWTERLQKKLGPYWSRITAKESPEGRREVIEILELADLVGMEEDELVEKVERRIELLDGVGDRLRSDEYRQFVSPAVGRSETGDFQVRTASVPPELRPYIEAVTLVTRLREVRALRGFTRIRPPDEENSDLAPLSVESKSWRPAIDVRGEGVFVELSEDRVESWEQQNEVLERCSSIPSDALPDKAAGALPRFLLLHSLAHVLIRSLSLECGYSIASLRERIYAGPEMRGLLLYTATPDSDGTLGGLVQQGVEERFIRIVNRAISDARWCASDPLCIRGNASLSEQLNLGVCHDCLLLPETSCEEFNRLLDRAALVGTPTEPGIGYFAGLEKGSG